MEAIWPEVFSTMELDGRENAALCADALAAWGLVVFTHTMPPSFGEVMAKIGIRLGIAATPENLMEWSDKWLNEQRNASNNSMHADADKAGAGDGRCYAAKEEVWHK